jgi:mitogen-activated protein kinase kinase kinase 17/18
MVSGRWTRLRTLGRGASGAVVSLAADAASGELFAVKSARGAAAATVLRWERKVMAGLSSPYVVRCVGGEGVDDTYSLFLEYAPGGSLADEAARNGGRLGDRDVRSYAAHVLRGLAYLHARSVVHGDVKPRNVVIGADGRAKLADFGCARTASSSHAARLIGGTPAFMAPEVARGEDQGPGADVWALGCTVVEMATGRAPWSGADDGVLAAVHRIGYTDAVPEVPAWLSAEARHFLACCFARNAGDRPTAAQLLEHPFVTSVSHEVKSLEWVSPKSTLDAAFWESAEEEEETSGGGSAAERIRSLACSAFPDWEDCNESGWITVLGAAPSRVSSSAAGVPAVGGGGGVSCCDDDEQLETEVPLGAVVGAGAGPSSVRRQESKRCSSAECRVGVLPPSQCVHRLCDGIDLIKLWLTTKFDILVYLVFFSHVRALLA